MTYKCLKKDSTHLMCLILQIYAQMCKIKLLNNVDFYIFFYTVNFDEY